MAVVTLPSACEQSRRCTLTPWLRARGTEAACSCVIPGAVSRHAFESRIAPLLLLSRDTGLAEPPSPLRSATLPVRSKRLQTARGGAGGGRGAGRRRAAAEPGQGGSSPELTRPPSPSKQAGGPLRNQQ